MSLRCFRPVFVTSVFTCAAGTPLFAHEKWFVDGESPPLALGRATETLPLALITVAVILATALWGWFVGRGRRDLLPDPSAFGAEQTGLARFYGLVPLILGIHTAIPLLVCGLKGELFSPNNALTGGPKYWFGVVQTGIALAIFYGAFTRVAAVALAGVWFVGGFFVGRETMWDNAHLLGLAAFFFLVGRGPWSIDRLLIPVFEPSASFQRRGLLAARIGLGVALIAVAFTEKLANPDLATAFLEKHDLNFTPSLGIPMTDYAFAMCAGGVELLVGLCLLFGIFPHVIILIAWLPFNLTLTHFNWVELVGHLPFYGMLAVFLVWDPVRHVEVMSAGFRGEEIAPRNPAPSTMRSAACVTRSLFREAAIRFPFRVRHDIEFHAMCLDRRLEFAFPNADRGLRVACIEVQSPCAARGNDQRQERRAGGFESFQETIFQRVEPVQLGFGAGQTVRIDVPAGDRDRDFVIVATP
ncbi:MAG: hypothetical protein QM811_23615 [Pirellulales bacterium]